MNCERLRAFALPNDVTPEVKLEGAVQVARVVDLVHDLSGTNPQVANRTKRRPCPIPSTDQWWKDNGQPAVVNTLLYALSQLVLRKNRLGGALSSGDPRALF